MLQTFTWKIIWLSKGWIVRYRNSNDILIEGSLNNIFGGKGMPSIKILVQTEQGPSSGKASHSPKMLNFPGSVGFFIELEEESFEVDYKVMSF